MVWPAVLRQIRLLEAAGRLDWTVVANLSDEGVSGAHGRAKRLGDTSRKRSFLAEPWATPGCSWFSTVCPRSAVLIRTYMRRVEVVCRVIERGSLNLRVRRERTVAVLEVKRVQGRMLGFTLHRHHPVRVSQATCSSDLTGCLTSYSSLTRSPFRWCVADRSVRNARVLSDSRSARPPSRQSS